MLTLNHYFSCHSARKPHRHFYVPKTNIKQRKANKTQRHARLEEKDTASYASEVYNADRPRYTALKGG